MDILLLSVLGGVLALDATAAGQFMISRPLVAGVLAGAAVGTPVQGATIGAILELYLLVAVPSGGARFPEGATATAVAVASAAASGGPGAIPLGVAVGLVWGQVGGVSVDWQRRLNGTFVPEPSDLPASGRRVVSAHLAAVGLDFLRGTVVTLLGAVAGRAVVGRFAATFPVPMNHSVPILVVGGAVSAGIYLRNLGGFRRRMLLFLAGIALGFGGGSLL